jgi:glutathione S-transferase
VAISDFLADKKFLFGDEPASADASVFASVACALCPHFDTPIRRVAETHPNLADYVRRCMQRWYPELANAKTN